MFFACSYRVVVLGYWIKEKEGEDKLISVGKTCNLSVSCDEFFACTHTYISWEKSGSIRERRIDKLIVSLFSQLKRLDLRNGIDETQSKFLHANFTYILSSNKLVFRSY